MEGGSRSLAHVHELLLRRWEGRAGEGYATSEALFRHCYAVMDKYIARDKLIMGSPLGGTIGHLTGLPSPVDYQMWRDQAGMGVHGNGLSKEVDLDALITGDETVQGRDHEGDSDEEDIA